MITKDYSNAKQTIKPFPSKRSKASKKGIDKTLSWYMGRVHQLENEQKQLNDYISEYRTYLDHQSSSNRKLKATIREMRKIYEAPGKNYQWVVIPKSVLHKAIFLGFGLFISGLVMYAMGIGYITI